MRAGEMKYRIQIERQGAFQNEFGEEERAWSLVCTVWAAVLPQRGFERYLAQQTMGEQTKVFSIRYRKDISIGMRIRLNMDGEDRYYNIADVDRESLGYRQALKVTATYLEGAVA